MKILVHCTKCAKEPQKFKFQLYEEIVRDDSIYQLNCSNGHSTTMVLTNFKHEILFDIAVNALADGYYRESVTSFHAALERFRELYVRLAMRKLNLERDKEDNLWKEVRNQSERQYGAYVFIRSLFSSKAMLPMPQGQIAFRNNVVHKGKIPSRSEAIAFGDCVWNCINQDHIELSDLFNDEGTDVVSQFFQEYKNTILQNSPTENLSGMRNIGTFCLKKNEKTRTLAASLELVESSRV